VPTTVNSASGLRTEIGNIANASSDTLVIELASNITASSTSPGSDGQPTAFTIDVDSSDTLVIKGKSGGKTIDAAQLGRVFDIRDGDVTLRALTITGGRLSGDGADSGKAVVGESVLGAGIRNAAETTLTNVTLDTNVAAAGGGGGLATDNAQNEVDAGGGGGGGSGFNGTGGGDGGNGYQSGKTGGGGNGGDGGNGAGGIALGGGGGRDDGTGGAGGDSVGSYTAGGAGGAVGGIGGDIVAGGGGAGVGFSDRGGKGGDAVGGIFNASGGTLTVVDSAFSNNAGAGGGGGGGDNGENRPAGSGGNAVGAIENAGTLTLDSSSQSAAGSGNAAAGGQKGTGSASASTPAADGTATPGIAGARTDLGGALTRITSPTTTETFAEGEMVTIEAVFSESVTLSGGPLDLTLNTGDTVGIGTFSGQSTASTTYTVPMGASEPDLNVTGVTLNGTLEDGDGDPVETDLPIGENLKITTDIALDGVAPSVSSGIAVDGGPAATASSVDFTVTFDEAVQNIGTGDFTLSTTNTASGNIADVSSGGGGNEWLVTVDGITGEGDLTVDFDGGQDITDAAGNALASLGSDATHTADRVAPSASVSLNGAFGETASAVTYEVDFGEPVNNFGVDDLNIVASGGASGALGTINSSGGGVYTVDVDSLSGDGNVALEVVTSGDVADTAGNALASNATGPAHITNLAPPELNSISLNAGPSATDTSVTYTVTFDEGVENVTGDDFTVNTTGSVTTDMPTVISGSGGDSSYTVEVSNIDGEGTQGLTLTTSDIQDTAGNALMSGGSTGTRTVDTVAPTTNSVSLDGSPDANATSLTYSVVFDEDVSGLDSGSFSVTGTAAGAASITGVAQDGGADDWNVSVDVASGASGSITLDLDSPSGVTDDVGNVLSSGATSGTHTVDTQAPTVTTFNQTSGSPGSSSIAIDVDFSETVNTFGADDVDVTFGGGASGSLAVSGSGANYTLTVESLSGDGSVDVAVTTSGDVADTAGNALASGSGTISHTVNRAQPEIDTISSNTPGAASSSVTYTVTFTEAVEDVTAGDFSVGTSAGVSANAPALTSGTDGDSTYTVQVDGLSGDGTQDLTVNVNNIQDTAGNALASGSTSSGRAVDTVQPEIDTFGFDGSPSATDSSVTASLTFDEAVQNVTPGDFDFTKSGGAGSDTLSVTQVGGDDYDVTVNNITGTGSFDLALTTGNITDPAGNALVSGSATLTHDVDREAPAVGGVTIPSPPGPMASSVDFNVTFAEDVQNFGTNDLDLDTTGSASGSIGTITQNAPDDYTVTVNSLSGDGDLGLDVVTSGDVADTVGNALGSGFTSGDTHAIDLVQPTVSSVGASGGPFNETQTITITLDASEDLSGSGASLDLDIGGGSGSASFDSLSGGDALFTYDVSGGDSGDVSVTGVNVGGLTDSAGNALDGSLATTDLGVDVDTTDPTTTGVSLQSSPAENATSVIYDVTFSEPVNGLGASNFGFTGTISGAASITNVAQDTGGDDWNVDVSIPSGEEGTLGLDLSSLSGVTDAAGNPLASGDNSTNRDVDTDQPSPTGVRVVS